MAVLMANASEVSSRENVQYLYNKNVELETKRRKSAQARIPTDPNVWQQMRENFETILLVDHAFAEQHEIELALWQMHYRKIEENRANFNAVMAMLGSPPGDGRKTGSTRTDRLAKIRSQMRTFLSETTGFYHELMLKIKAKYGLPLGYFSDDTENEAFLSKEGNMSPELKKGLISCHRCLIYLGDLARYKGIYGEDESKLRDFAAASGYYMQSFSFWPSSGNPHHQLAILASYSGDEFVAVYRYFRSLAVENPFSIARDNLIIAFEKNRLNFCQLIGGPKTPAAKPVPAQMNAKGRARAEARFSGNDHKVDARLVKERVASTTCTTKTFSIKFIRLHGILFSRTSLETFTDVLSMAKNDFKYLLSSQSEDVRSFGSDAAESELFVVRLVAILIFSVRNAGRDSEDQLLAEILQQTVLLQYAYAAAYEFMGIIIKRCLKLQDPLSSFLLPGFLVFVEWLACRPEAPHVYEEEKLANMRAFFWKNCVSIFNKALCSGLLVEDDSGFLNRSRCEEGETRYYPSLREDFELRGFLPLESAQKILDFSRKYCSIGVEGGNKEKRARVQRILAAARALSSVVRVGEQFVYFDPKLKKFVIGTEPLVSCDFRPKLSITPQNSRCIQDVPAEKRMDLVVLKPSQQLFVDNEDEEEEIVFKPFTADQIADAITCASNPENVPRAVVDTTSMNLTNHIASVAPAVATIPDFFYNGVAQHVLPIQLNSLNWQLSAEASIMNEFKNSSFMANGHSRNIELQDQYGGLQPPSLSPPFMQPVKSGADLRPVVESVTPSKSQPNMSSAYALHGLSITPGLLLPVGAKRRPVSRPLRHAGPPPGFIPSLKHTSELKVKDDDICIVDDYSWLDGYQVPSSKLTPEFNSSCNLSRQTYFDESKCSSMAGMVSFPFPGKQVSAFQVPVENPKGGRRDYHLAQPLNLFQEQTHHLMQTGSQQGELQQKHFQGQSLWDGQFLV